MNCDFCNADVTDMEGHVNFHHICPLCSEFQIDVHMHMETDHTCGNCNEYHVNVQNHVAPQNNNGDDNNDSDNENDVDGNDDNAANDVANDVANDDANNAANNMNNIDDQIVNSIGNVIRTVSINIICQRLLQAVPNLDKTALINYINANRNTLIGLTPMNVVNVLYTYIEQNDQNAVTNYITTNANNNQNMFFINIPAGAPNMEDVKMKLTDVAFNELKHFTAEADITGACSICLADFEENDKIVQTKCNHSFHTPCLHKWSTSSYKCPMCRAEMGTSERVD
jgi:hypothetical protein